MLLGASRVPSPVAGEPLVDFFTFFFAFGVLFEGLGGNVPPGEVAAFPKRAASSFTLDCRSAMG